MQRVMMHADGEDLCWCLSLYSSLLMARSSWAIINFWTKYAWDFTVIKLQIQTHEL